jgi:steroid 5-alpha reductase family enzyme
MRKALASIVVIVFAGLLCTSLLTLFSGGPLGKEMSKQQVHYPFYMSY